MEAHLITQNQISSQSCPDIDTPNERLELPPEILQQIFHRLIEIASTSSHVLSGQSWAISQVCRSWRSTSRAMPEFWGLSIDLPSTSRREEVSELDRIKFSLKQLKGALDILPEVASIALSLKLAGSRLRDETRPLWVELARSNPMPNMASFTSLNIDMGVEYLEILLLHGFPWHHLKSFWVHWRDRPELAPKIMNTLEKCTSLITFGTCGWGFPIADSSSPATYNVELPPLVHLSIGQRLPRAMVKALWSLATLRSLDLGCVSRGQPISLETFYELVERCPRLTTLQCPLMTVHPASRRSRIVLSPCLVSLTIQLRGDETLIPTLLRAPLLASFLITDGVCRPAAIDHILDFITSSGLQLQTFRMHCLASQGYVKIPQQKIWQLLSSLNACSDVDIPVHFTVTEDMLSAFANRDLLPQVERLVFIFSDPQGFLMSMQRRLEREQAAGRVILQDSDISFSVDRPDSDIAAFFEREFSGLESRYNIQCKILWKRESPFC